MRYNEYLLRTYDTFFKDVRSERVSKFVDDDAAILAARHELFLLYPQAPQAPVEIQICRRGLGVGEWVMFAAVFYDYDGSILVEDCFC